MRAVTGRQVRLTMPPSGTRRAKGLEQRMRPSRRHSVRALSRLLLSLALVGAGPDVAHAAAPGDRTARAEATAAEPGSAPRPSREGQEQLAKDLEAYDDDALACRHAAGWSTLRIVVVVLLIIFLLPIGLIVLITLLIVDPP